VTARLQLIEQARKVLPAEVKLDGLGTRVVHELVLKKLDDKLDLTSKSDDYVTARFDAVTASAGTRNDSLGAARNAATTSPVAAPPAARQDAFIPDWQRPLSVSSKN
jgi:hypothetical protein